MERSGTWLKTNLVYGLVVIVPLAVLLLLLAKLVEMLRAAADYLELESTLGAGIAMVAAFLLLLLVCLGMGMMVRTRLGTWSFARIEKAILRHLPGYEIVGNILKGFAAKSDAYPAVMVSLYGPGSAAFGLAMEEHDNGTLTVFLPSAPALTVGSLHVVERDRVSFIGASSLDVANCVSQWGIGSGKILGQWRPGS